MFAGFMMNAWVVATIVAVVAGVVGFFVVLRGSAFPAHAIPKGAFAGAAGASLLGISTLIGLAVFSLLGALGIGALGRRGRHDVVTALALVMMLALGAAFLSQDHRVRAGDLLPALRRGPRGEHHRDPARRRPRRRLRRGGRRPLPAAHALLRRPRDSRGQGHPQPPHRDVLPRRRRPGDRHDRAGRRRPAHLQPDDRPARRRPVASPAGPPWPCSCRSPSRWSPCGPRSRSPTSTTGRSASSSACSARCPTASAAAGRQRAAACRSARTPLRRRESPADCACEALGRRPGHTPRAARRAAPQRCHTFCSRAIAHRSLPVDGLLAGDWGLAGRGHLVQPMRSAMIHLPVEGEFPSLSSATGWLNSPPLMAPGLRGKVGTGRLLDLHLHQLAADPSVPPSLGREIQGPGTGADRRAHAGVLLRARRRQRPPGGGGHGRRLSDRHRQRLRDLARLPQRILARPVLHRLARLHPPSSVRRGRLRTVGADHPAVACRERRQQARA